MSISITLIVDSCAQLVSVLHNIDKVVVAMCVVFVTVRVAVYVLESRDIYTMEGLSYRNVVQTLLLHLHVVGDVVGPALN